MGDVRKTTGEPHDKLTRLGNEVLSDLKAHPEYEPGMRAMVFINTDERGGIAFHGYDDDLREAVVDLLMHMRAMFKAAGKSLDIFPVPGNRSDLS